jgi:hypothetical protein
MLNVVMLGVVTRQDKLECFFLGNFLKVISYLQVSLEDYYLLTIRVGS